MKLYVGNFSYDMTEDRLRELFTPFGEPDSVSVISDRQTGQAKGFGFVEFSDASQAKAAMAALDKKEVDGRALTVNEARPKAAGTGGGGGARGRY
jgi:cold-inducible RNA-binding protein